MDQREAADVVVVGAGLTGAAAAWRLAQAGRDVLVLERDVPAGRLGSSHGSARIFRYGYADGFYTDLLRRAEAGWRELEEASGARLITRTGGLDFGPERRLDAVAGAFAAAGRPHELLAAGEAAERWPGISFDSPALFQPDAGVLDAEGTVAALLDAARAAGARVLTGWDVASVREGPAGPAATRSSPGTGAGRARAGSWWPRAAGSRACWASCPCRPAASNGSRRCGSCRRRRSTSPTATGWTRPVRRRIPPPVRRRPPPPARRRIPPPRPVRFRPPPRARRLRPPPPGPS
ncbi:FAD-dependent oxidoreductase [Rothia sp. AR01]|uniref:FAD-dependent oxidoreductase n=1 Tax=Rothia santali TaxID=2949643 RepID=A0A9X2KKD8_9MICC|nr:FAD-dependent oxidoreductase [Rothia santali]MCP3424946.1 FAD-dependent oxidoreductase [Rothia santali]